ncbi:putative PLAT/LH2 domain-containing protein [Dioscorea sansibarensis]
MMFPRAIPLLLLILSVIPSFIESQDNKMINNKINSDDNKYECVYAVYVQTGTKLGAGTDSVISLTLNIDDGHGIVIDNLVAWGGLMGPKHDYFEKGNLDIFSGRGPCLTSTPCRMNITSDGTGNNPAWLCDYVEVTTTSPRGICAQRLFKLEQWLDDSTPPYQRSAVRDYCSKIEDGSRSPAAPRRIAA